LPIAVEEGKSLTFVLLTLNDFLFPIPCGKIAKLFGSFVVWDKGDDDCWAFYSKWPEVSQSTIQSPAIEVG
jgi:hypothetical protein